MSSSTRRWHSGLFASVALVLVCVSLVGPAVADPSRKKVPQVTAAEKAAPPSVRAERALLAKPDDLGLLRDTARAYLAEAEASPSKRDAVAQHLERALRQAPNDVVALLLMGQLEIQRDRPAVAILYLQNLVRVAPDNAAAQLALGDALSRVGDENGAARAFAEYRRIQGMPPLSDGTSGK